MKKSNEQLKAIEEILQLKNGERLFLTGGAGTGKSTVIEALKEQRTDTILLASTGEAAENINAFTARPWHKGYGADANKKYKIKKEFATPRSRKKTLVIYLPHTAHRFIHWDLDGPKYGSPHENKRIKALANNSLLIIDEASMLNSDIADELIYNYHGPILFVGDKNQLTVNGIPESILSLEHIHLTKNFRTQSESIQKLVEACDLAVINVDNGYKSGLKISDHVNNLDIFEIKDHSEFLKLIKNCEDAYWCIAYNNHIVKSYLTATNFYGSSITAHKSQGKSIDVVFFDMANVIQEAGKRRSTYQGIRNHPLAIEDAIRLINVAISRTVKQVYIYTGTSRNF